MRVVEKMMTRKREISIQFCQVAEGPFPFSPSCTRVTLVYRQEPVDANAFTQAVAAACVSDGGNEAKLLVMDGDGGARAKKAAELLSTSGFQNVVVVRGGANAWKNAWDSTMRRRQLAGSFSRGFDNPMFADSNVTAEEFGASTDDTVWVV